MLKQKLSPFEIKKTINKIFTTAFFSSLAYFTTNKINLDTNNQNKYDQEFDLAVIGGGSGGLATAFQAAKHGLKVIVIDYVEQSPQKTKWGLGGTCVNVGCIPKKLFHRAAKFSQDLFDSNDYGWELPEQMTDRFDPENKKKLMSYFNWTKLKEKVDGYIKSINFGYVSQINKDVQLEYLNMMATFKDKHTLICTKNVASLKQFVSSGKLPQAKMYQQIKAKNFVIATGTRPTYLQIQGSNLAITSDDIFSRKNPPGKTLVVGGGYVAVQIAGFLNGLGFDVTLMTRGEYLRAFDRDMVKQIIHDLQQRKVNIVPTSLPTSLKKVSIEGNDKIEAIIQNKKQINAKSNGRTEVFDTVLFAVGRYATTNNLNLSAVGVSTTQSKKIKTRSNQIDRTQTDHIYALGDVVQGLPELTSTAVKMGANLGRRIAHRMNKKSFKDKQMFISLQNYPTTVFTPLQYSCCGLNEEQAIKKYGRQNISVYHIKYMPLQQSILDKYNEDGTDYKEKVYAKAVVNNSNDKVLGLHYAGPNAGEVMQGFAVAMKIGLTKQALNSTIGIHPTAAEDITNMTVTKESGEQFQKKSC